MASAIPRYVRERFFQRSGPGGMKWTSGSRPSTISVGTRRGRFLSHQHVAKALGLTSQGGNAFMRTVNRLGSEIPEKLRIALDNPIVFIGFGGDPGHGYEATVLIELCDAIWEAQKNGKLHPRQT